MFDRTLININVFTENCPSAKSVLFHHESYLSKARTNNSTQHNVYYTQVKPLRTERIRYSITTTLRDYNNMPI